MTTDTGNSSTPGASEADTVSGGNLEENLNQDTVGGADSGQPNPDANAADSSDAGKKPDANEPARTLLDVVKDAVKVPDAKETSSVSEDKKGDDKGTDSQKKADGEEDLPPFHKHPRWMEVQEELKSLRGPAEQFRKVDEFMHKNNLVPTEVAQGLKVMALIKNAPERALEELERFADEIRLQLGIKLPADLQEQVEKGYITEEKAKELSVTKRQKEELETKLEGERTNRSVDAHKQLQSDIASEITTWETALSKSDPDYSVKQPLVLDRVRGIVMERGYGLKSVTDAREVAEQALKDVTAKLKPVLSKNRTTPIRNMPPAGNMPVSSEPKTLGETIRAAAAG